MAASEVTTTTAEEKHKAGSTSQQLNRTLGPLMLWGLGVGYVISGMYFGWNLGLEKGGTGGLAIATFFIIILYVSFTFSYTELACAIPKAGGVFARPGARHWFCCRHGTDHRIRVCTAGHCRCHRRVLSYFPAAVFGDEHRHHGILVIYGTQHLWRSGGGHLRIDHHVLRRIRAAVVCRDHFTAF